jgi:hypothetical protein
VPALCPASNAAAISMIPPAKAQIPTTSTSTSAVGPGQTIAITPAASAISASSRWPNTGPAVSLLNARMACSPASMNAYTANKMTSARIVTPGQASAMMPTTMASTPMAPRPLRDDGVGRHHQRGDQQAGYQDCGNGRGGEVGPGQVPSGRRREPGPEQRD